MSREAFGDPPEPQAPRCPVCDGTEHADNCELGEEMAKRRQCEAELCRLRSQLEPLRRLWPLIERSMNGLVFTADRAGEVAADMAALRRLQAP